MRQLKLTVTPERIPALGLLTQVVQLSEYDMLYVFSKIQKGDSLLLQRDENHPFDRNAIAVYFGSYKLGYLSDRINHIVCNHLKRGRDVSAKVHSLQKIKRSPLSAMDVALYIRDLHV